MFGKNPKPKHEHTFGKWERKELHTSTSFNSSAKLFMERQCTECGWIETRFLEEVRA